MSKFNGSSRLHKDLQGVAAFAAYVGINKRKTMSSSDIEKNMERMYVSDPADDESMGLANQLLCGIGMFACLYNVEDMPTATSSGAGARGIKPELNCLGEGKRILVGGNSGGLMLRMMLVASLADKEPQDAKGVRGRSLYARTKYDIQKCKKALAVVLRHDSPYIRKARNLWFLVF